MRYYPSFAQLQSPTRFIKYSEKLTRPFWRQVCGNGRIESALQELPTDFFFFKEIEEMYLIKKPPQYQKRSAMKDAEPG